MQSMISQDLVSNASAYTDDKDEEARLKTKGSQRTVSKQPTFMKKKTVTQKKSMMFRAITQAKEGKQAQVQPDILDLDVFTDDFVDENGKTIRWRRMIEPETDVKYLKYCCCRRGERLLSEIEAEATLTQINEELSERLDQRARAMSNWKRLKIVIVILKLCNGRIDRESEEKSKEEVA